MTEETRLILEKLDKMDTRISGLESTMDEKISALDTKITNLESSMDEKISTLDAKITNLESTMNEKISTLEFSMNEKISTLDAKITNLESSMEAKITDLRLTLENETNRNIKLIAEGHLDLSRKLDEALKVENEKELLLIRVNTLENEVRKIKMRLGEIA